MPNYLITAQAEVLYEKAHRILAKYMWFEINNKETCPQCIKSIVIDLSAFAKKIILCETTQDIENAKLNLIIYENIIDNISMLSSDKKDK
ncbi:MAG: hypothetical protein PUG48_00510 [Clostridia bacterium]|nr:hypothetical protein [Clostridia bacterium]